MDTPGKHLRAAELAVMSDGMFVDRTEEMALYKFPSEANALVFACQINFEKLFPKIVIGRFTVLLSECELGKCESM